MELFETMLVSEGKIKNLNLHIKRAKKSAKYFKWKFNENEWLNLQEKLPYKENLRMRVTYNQKGIKEIELFKIKKRNFNKFKVVEINFNYFLKKKNRSNFEKIKQKHPSFDEFILIKNHLVTDSTISNLAFFDGKKWLTPKYPLLFGTKREELINKNFLQEANIKLADLKYFKKMALINAILGFYEIDEFDIIF